MGRAQVQMKWKRRDEENKLNLKGGTEAETYICIVHEIYFLQNKITYLNLNINTLLNYWCIDY